MRLPLILRWSRLYHDGMRHFDDGDHVAAERELLTAIELAECLRPHGERLACSLFALGRLYDIHRRFAEADALLKRSLRVERAALGEDHPFTRDITAAYTHFLRRQRREREADAVEGRAAHARRATRVKRGRDTPIAA